jgi:hypothetical protein
LNTEIDNTTMRIALISCSSKKQSHPCKAMEMYSASPLFTKAFSYCCKNYDKVYILSAKYGLLDPEEIIEPYDTNLNTISKKARSQWAELVVSQVKKEQQQNRLRDVELFAFHAGRKYRRNLITHLEEIAPCEVPLEGMGIGERLHYYTTMGF